MSSRRRLAGSNPPGPRPGVRLPTALGVPGPKLVEIPVPPGIAAMSLNHANDYIRAYRLGECTVLVTREYGRWHMSISHRDRDPTWSEVVVARYGLIPGDVTAAMILPPLDDHVNINVHCYQVIEIHDPILDRL